MYLHRNVIAIWKHSTTNVMRIYFFCPNSLFACFSRQFLHAVRIVALFVSNCSSQCYFSMTMRPEKKKSAADACSINLMDETTIKDAWKYHYWIFFFLLKCVHIVSLALWHGVLCFSWQCAVCIWHTDIMNCRLGLGWRWGGRGPLMSVDTTVRVSCIPFVWIVAVCSFFFYMLFCSNS